MAGMGGALLHVIVSPTRNYDVVTSAAAPVLVLQRLVVGWWRGVAVVALAHIVPPWYGAGGYA